MYKKSKINNNQSQIKKEKRKNIENQNKIYKKQSKGITLIALVITIIVLLILAGVSLATIFGDDGILEKAQEARDKTNQSQYDEQYALQSVLDEFNYVNPSEDGYNETAEVNSPKVTKGMIPIKWNGTNWEVCSENDKDWYDYINGGKLWANVMLSDGTYKSGIVKEGTIVEEKDLGSMYVWIPRYAYQMPVGASTGTKGTIAVTFLKGNTNTDKDGNTYQKATTEVNTEETAIVHPAFTIGEKELTGIWVAKFEASGKNGTGEAVGNATKDGNNGAYNPVEPDNTTIAKSLPNVPSWRNISAGESQYQSMAIAGQNKEKFGIDYCSSHLIRNSEWGAVAYLCYSNYGNVPKINACGSSNTWYYNLYTGQGPNTGANTETHYEFDSNTTIAIHGYSTANGMLASTTGNITGIYDMNGGAWERVAAYFDNENGNLDAYGKSTSKPEIKYFEGGKLNSEYSSLWECYEVSEEEKNNKIEISESEILNQNELWNKKGANFKDAEINKKYNIARKRLTDATFDLLAKVKGIGVNEVASSHSYYGVNINGNLAWLLNEDDTNTKEYGQAWDNDYVLMGHASLPFVVRGGHCYYGGGAGVLYSNVSYGYAASSGEGFRSVLVV